MVKTLKRFLPPGSNFVDVGANEGYFSVLGASLVGECGRVVAVEPQIRLKPVIENNFKLNGVRNATLYGVAVSNIEGIADIYLSPDMNTGSSGLISPNRYRVAKQQVRTVTLAQLLASAAIDKVDLMKMDIEGFEYEAVLGSKELFRDGRINAFALELHPESMRRRGIDPREIVDFLQRFGYREDNSTGNTVYLRRNK